MPIIDEESNDADSEGVHNAKRPKVKYFLHGMLRSNPEKIIPKDQTTARSSGQKQKGSRQADKATKGVRQGRDSMEIDKEPTTFQQSGSASGLYPPYVVRDPLLAYFSDKSLEWIFE